LDGSGKGSVDNNLSAACRAVSNEAITQDSFMRRNKLWCKIWRYFEDTFSHKYLRLLQKKEDHKPAKPDLNDLMSFITPNMHIDQKGT
jgi:hypothetical protein